MKNAAQSKTKVYVLDAATWRCGRNSQDPRNFMGVGKTWMLNYFGYSDCLGQFALQRLRKVGKSRKGVAHLVGNEREPSGLAWKLKFAYDENFVDMGSLGIFPYNTLLSRNLIDINDDPTTAVKEKINLIRTTLKSKGLQLRVINQHLIPD